MKKQPAVGFEIRKLHHLIKREVEHSASFQYEQATGLHGWAIGWLYENRERDIFQRDLEERFSIQRSTASNMLALMEKNGMIVRQAVDSDKRLKKIVLTEDAVRLCQMFRADIGALEKRLTAGIEAADLACFFRVIEQMKANLEEEHD